jgi:hypothetical protein
VRLKNAWPSIEVCTISLCWIPRCTFILLLLYLLVEDLKQRTVALSEYVWAALGGSDPGPVQSAIAVVKSRDPSNAISLGDVIALRRGVCRHRSILFKYLCDHMHRFPAQWALTSAASKAGASAGVVMGAIPCQLVRGVLTDGSDLANTENHMWNVVRLGHELFVVDVMQRPRELLDAESKEAQAYQRAILLGAQTQVRVLKTEVFVILTM